MVCGIYQVTSRKKGRRAHQHKRIRVQNNRFALFRSSGIEELEECFEYIVTVSKYEQCQQEPEANRVGYFQELVAGFLACDNLPQQEQYISSI